MQNFVNNNLQNGLKNKIVKNCLNLLKAIKFKSKNFTTFDFDKTLENLRLLVYVYKRKRGSKVILIPKYWSDTKKYKKGFALFYKIIKKRGENRLQDRFQNEFFEIMENKGKTIQQRNEIYLNAKLSQHNLRYVKKFKLKDKEYQNYNDYGNLMKTKYAKLELINVTKQLNYYDQIKFVDESAAKNLYNINMDI